MQVRQLTVMSGLAAGLGLLSLSCGGSLDLGTGGASGADVHLALPEIAGRYVIAAGQEKQSKAILPRRRINESQDAMLVLDPGKINFTPDADEGGELTITFAFGEVAGFAEACAEPIDAYPSFTVTVGTDGEVQNISPPGIPAQKSTLNLIDGGEYTICVTFSSTVAGIVIIEAVSLDFGS